MQRLGSDVPCNFVIVLLMFPNAMGIGVAARIPLALRTENEAFFAAFGGRVGDFKRDNF